MRCEICGSLIGHKRAVRERNHPTMPERANCAAARFFPEILSLNRTEHAGMKNAISRFTNWMNKKKPHPVHQTERGKDQMSKAIIAY